MKKETIFRHELNESIQADAAMNCLKNRNKPQQLNEFHPAGLARIALPLLKPVIRKIVANLVSKVGAKAITGSRLMHTVMNKLNAGTIAKVAQKIGETWTEVPEELKQEIWAFAVHTFKELLEKENAQPQPATQEQEEGADEKATFALKLVKKFKNKMTPDYAKNPELFMMLKLQKALKKPLMSLSKEEYRAWAKAICDACESVFGSAQEQEELPQMERRDMILALAEYMSESWIDTGDDGDLDDIYYAIADILDKTGDYPQSTDWEDCKPWCQKHYKEVEARIY